MSFPIYIVTTYPFAYSLGHPSSWNMTPPHIRPNPRPTPLKTVAVVVSLDCLGVTTLTSHTRTRQS